MIDPLTGMLRPMVQYTAVAPPKPPPKPVVTPVVPEGFAQGATLPQGFVLRAPSELLSDNSRRSVHADKKRRASV
jgi:hypothetical protein